MAIKYSSLGGGTGTGFNVQITSKYSYATFLTAQPAGSYTIKSAGNFTNWDVYVLDASNNLVAYTGGAALSAPSSFSAIVVLNGSINDILQFSFQSTVTASATTSQIKAGPFITAFGSSVIPNQNSAVTITGGNFAPGIAATFTGTDSVVRVCKSVVYTSTSSISVVRPDSMPIAYAPYTLTLTNPSVSNPTNSNSHILTGLTVGSAPSWTTGTSLAAAEPATAYSATVVATDPDVGGSITYSYVSGTLPTGLSFNAGTGVISGSYSGSSDGSTSYTIRATDSGGNFTDRTFTIAFTSVSGGTLSSDATYYYRIFYGNGTLNTGGTLTADVLLVAGGGGGGTSLAGGGGGGGVAYATSKAITGGSYQVLVGAGGAGSPDTATPGGRGIQTSAFGQAVTGGQGGRSRYQNSATWPIGANGGGGACDTNNTTSGQGVKDTAQSGWTTYGGFRGGNSLVPGSDNYPGGGGGGAGANGADATSSTAAAGNGGIGVSITIHPNGSYYWAGGGGGSSYTGSAGSGNGGNGGGGGGSDNSNSPGSGGAGLNAGGNGLAGGGNSNANQSGGAGGQYTGGGAGASSHEGSNPNGIGGSGIVIVRYTRASVGG